MGATGIHDAQSGKGDKARLNVEHLDEVAAKRGIHGPDAQAAFLGISRSHLYRMRNGQHGASMTVGLHMARKLRTTVEKLFSRAAS